MTKAALFFNLNIAEDRDAFQLAQEASKLQSIIFEYDQLLRQYQKHGYPDDIKTAGQMLDKLRKELFRIIDDENLTVGF